MSAPIEQVVLNEQVPIVDEVKVKKPKKPTLPAKHAKFMQFGAWFAQLLLESGDIDSALFDKMRTKLTVFDDFHPQMSFYSAFADQYKDFNKSLRKEIVAHHRAIAKANKPPKSKKAPLSDKSQSDFIANIISDAQSSLPLTPPTPPPSPKPSPKPSQQKLQKKSTPTTDPTPEVVQQSLDSTPLPPATPSVTLPPTPPLSTDNKPLTMKKPKKVKKTSATDEPTA
jgi:hypothetical protein